MAKPKKVKKRKARLDRDTHHLEFLGVDSNCYLTVLAEFSGGHQGPKSFKGRFTTEEWYAILRHSMSYDYGGDLDPAVFFGGVRSTIEENNALGQDALMRFLRREGNTVRRLETEKHVMYTASLTKKFIEKVNKFNEAPYYMDEDDGEEDSDYETGW